VGFDETKLLRNVGSTCNIMSKFNRIAIVAAGATLVAHGAQAAFTVNDLYLGFTQSAATSDLIIDLGQASSLIGGSSVLNLSGDLGGLTSFNSTFNNSPNGVSMAVVGGDATFGQFGVFATQLRAGGAGTASVAGSSISLGHSSSQMSGGATVISGLASGGLPSAGNSILDPNKSYSLSINVTTGANTFVGKTGVNPASVIDNTGVIYEDLWGATTTTPYTYEGYFTLDYNNDSLNFTPASVAAVPEPSTYSLFTGAGVLALSLHRRFRRKTI
jgi:hypothetical protein